VQGRCTRSHAYAFECANTLFNKVRAGMIEVLPRASRHFDQLYIGVDLLFVTFTSPFCMAPTNSIVLHGAPVILGFTPAGPLEFLNAEKFFKLQAAHSVFGGAACLMC
jgi:hypothetical protein